MVKPKPSRTAARNAPQAKVHQYVPALVADDFGGMRLLTASTANSFAKKKLDAASQRLQLRIEQRAGKARASAARAYAIAERGVQAEIHESNYRARQLSRRLKTKVRPERKLKHTQPKARKRLWPHAAIALPKYDGPVIDRRGQRGVFVRVRYYSRRSARQGVSTRVVKYVFHGAEVDAFGEPYVESNVGLTIDETLCAFDHLEQVNWSAAKNAKLLMHGIFAVDHRQTPDEMMECGTRWAEQTLGRFDLPYVVTLHAPPPDGDERNWHLHILWSFRPLVRTGDHEWDVAEMLRTDLDNPAAMKVMREMFASVMTEISYEAGQRQVYTAKSNADRGLPHEPQVHLGAAQTNRARNGGFVVANEENHERVQRSRAAVLDDKLRQVDEALAKQQTLAQNIAGRWARLPILPLSLPKRVEPARIAVELPAVEAPPSRISVPIHVPAQTPRAPNVAADLPLLPGAPSRMPMNPAANFGGTALISPPCPAAPAQPAQIEIANLRISRPARSADPINPSMALPTVRAEVMPMDLPKRQRFAGIEQSSSDRTGTIPSAQRLSKPSALALPASPPKSIPRSSVAKSKPPTPALNARALPPATAFKRLDITMSRAASALRRDKKRQEDEALLRIARERERNAGEAAERARAAKAELDHFLRAVIDERIFIGSDRGKPVVDEEVIRRFKIPAAVFADAAVQLKLKALADDQYEELAPLFVHLAIHPEHLIAGANGATIGEKAPDQVRRLASRWGHNPAIQARFEKAACKIAAAESRTVHTLPPSTDGAAAASSPPQPRKSWQSGPQFRERAMQDWRETDHLERRGMIMPGLQLPRPGTDRTVDPTPDRPITTRRMPGQHFGIGD